MSLIYLPIYEIQTKLKVFCVVSLFAWSRCRGISPYVDIYLHMYLEVLYKTIRPNFFMIVDPVIWYSKFKY